MPYLRLPNQTIEFIDASLYLNLSMPIFIFTDSGLQPLIPIDREMKNLIYFSGYQSIECGYQHPAQISILNQEDHLMDRYNKIQNITNAEIIKEKIAQLDEFLTLIGED